MGTNVLHSRFVGFFLLSKFYTYKIAIGKIRKNVQAAFIFSLLFSLEI